MNIPIQISAKHLGQLALGNFCARCFWVRLHCHDKFPFAIFPGIFSSIDSYSKKVTASHFAKHGRVPFWFDEIGEIGTPIKVPHWSKFNVTDQATGITLTGVPDEVSRKQDNTLFIGDYKCARFTDTADELMPLYCTQLNGYSYIAPRVGLGTVTSLGLLYYEPPGQLPESETDSLILKDSFFMRFTSKVLPVQVDTKTIPPLLAKTRQIYDLPSAPPGRSGCANCVLLDSLLAVATKRKTDGASPTQTAVPPGVVSIESKPRRKSADELADADAETELLTRVLRSSPEIELLQVNGDGDVIFSVSIKELTITRKELLDHPIVYSKFFADFVGEWLVRRHVFEFAELVTQVSEEEYQRKVLNYNHTKFGMVVPDNNHLQFRFHLSLVQSILTEDAKRVLGAKHS